MSFEFPAFLKLEHLPDGSAKSSFLAEVNGAMDAGERRIEAFSSEARRLLDSAISVQRNQFGSLDLGVDQIRAAAQAQQARAIAAREVAAATAAAAREEGDYSEQARLAMAATEALAREEEEAARVARSHADAVEQVQSQLNHHVSQTNAVVAATNRGTTAQQGGINAVRASRFAFVQLGQQMQDVTIQWQMGTRASQIFAQQVPQMAFALSGLADSANATQARIGRFATFLSGPWGAAIFAATAILGPFIYNLMGTGDAAKDAEKKTYDFTQGLDVLSLTAKQASDAMQQLAQEMRNAIAAQGDFLRGNALIAEQSVESLKARISGLSSELAGLRASDPIGHALFGDFGAMGQKKAEIDELTKALRQAREADTSARMALMQQSVIEASDPMAAARGQFDRAIGALNQRFRRSQDDPIGALNDGILISEAQYKAEFKRLTSLREAAEKAAREANKKPPKDNSAREAKRLADFGDRAAESIARINERFDEQPKLIDQAAQATRQLDAVIKDLTERKPAGFAEMIEDAERAKTVIQDALVRPFRDLATEATRQVEVQRLLTAGRETEATVLQAIWQMEQRIGPLNEQQAAAVREIVEAREDELEAVRRLQDEQSAYLDATRAVRGEIEAIFAGRGNIGNFQQIFRDLNARVLTQQLFGDVLEKLDDSVKAQFGRAVDVLERDTQRAGEAALTLADTFNEASRRIASGETGSARQSFVDAFGPDFVAGLTGASAGAPANDNTIVVTAQRLERGVAGMTPDAYAHMMARAVVKPLIDEMGDVLGPKLAEQIGGVMQGALYGYATGGDVGGVLGGVKGLVDGLLGEGSTLSKGLGVALGGAQMGQMVSGLAGAFGIKLSGTGSQVGGAIGSLLPIPGGNIIGAIAGGLLGKLFGSTKYGTAQLTGTSLSTFGKGKGRAEGAGTLGGSVQEALANIADRLDAEIGSYLVSIGTYKDNFRVSTRGGTGKLGGYDGSWSQINQRYGLYDFGDDQGAAIAFAVLDAIKDGAIKGLKAGAQRLLQQGGDVEKAVQDALDFQSVFTRLKELKDPVGADLDKLDAEFERLKSLFTKASASTQEWTDLEQLYWLERDQIIKDATERELGTLRGFMTDLTVGNSALSLRDRKASALANYTPLANRVAAGDATAYDGFVDAARALLDIERQMSGSQSGYFDLLNQVTGLTQGALNGGAGASFAGRDTPFGAPPPDNAGVIASIGDTNALLETLVSGVDAMNKNFGTLIDVTETQRNAAAIKYAAGNLGW